MPECYHNPEIFLEDWLWLQAGMREKLDILTDRHSVFGIITAPHSVVSVAPTPHNWQHYVHGKQRKLGYVMEDTAMVTGISQRFGSTVCVQLSTFPKKFPE
jgi:hypothetical protein